MADGRLKMSKNAVPASDQRTQLGARLRRFREKEALTLDQLRGRLGFGTIDYISKVENGRIKQPKQRFLEALANVMNTTVEELAELSVSPAPEAPLAEPIPRLSRPTLFKLVFGHSLWGAPIFEAAHGERIPQFNVTSFAEPDIDCSVATTKLGWIQPNSTFPTPRPGSGLVALSAANVVALLRRGEADVGALPGNIVPSDFIRVGTVVDSVAGCTFV